MSIILVLAIVLAALFSLASFGAGIYFIVRYAKTRRTLFLILGLVLMFILPGVCLCVVLGVYIPSTTIVYGPPPSFPTFTP